VKGLSGKRARRSRCGVYDCSACDVYLAEKCPGCASGNLHLRREGERACAVYECVRELGIAGCHECTEPTCRLGSLRPTRCPLRDRFGGEGEGRRFWDKLAGTKGVATGEWERAELSPRLAERLCRYLRVVEQYEERGVPTVSSHQVARAAGVRSSLVRRDISALGRFGTPGRGYAVERMGAAIRRCLKLGRARPALWLGDARRAAEEQTVLALAEANCRLVGVFDAARQGQKAAGIVVQSPESIAAEAKRHRARIAILASEELARPDVIDELAASGVQAVLNLTRARLTASARVAIEQADLGSHLLRVLSRAAIEAKGGARRRKKQEPK